MTQQSRLLSTILSGTSDANVRFVDLCRLLRFLGFSERVRGSHHIYTKVNVTEILNLQPKGTFAKVYQVKQVRSVIVRYRLGGTDDESV